MAPFTLRQLEYFIACAELGSMRAASENVHLTQSAISTSIGDLEKSLGVQLLIRHARGLSLTQAGIRVLADARRLIGNVEDLQASARDLSEALVGGLRVGCYSTLAPVLLPKIAADFSEAHPEVELDIIEGSHTDLEEELRTGGCELVVAYDYRATGQALPADLEEITVRSAPPHIALPANHRLAGRESIRLEEVADEPFILFDLPPGGQYFLNVFSEVGLSPWVKFRTQSFETARSLVARGLGYSILTQQTVVRESYEGLGLVTLPLADELPELNIVVLQLRAVQATQRAAAFKQQCLDSLRT